MASKRSKVKYEKVEGLSPRPSLEMEESDDEEESNSSMPEVIHGTPDSGRSQGGMLFRTFRARFCTSRVICISSFSILCMVALLISSNNHHSPLTPSHYLPPSPDDTGGDSGGNDFEPLSPTEREKEITHRLKVVSGMSVSMPGTPQHKATHWILKEDASVLTADDPNILQRYFLALLYFKMEGAENINSGFNKNMNHLEFWMDGLMHECDWKYVGCDGNGFITSLTLNDCGLTGPLPSEIYVLHGLMHLDFSTNHLTGLIPRELQNLENLKEVYLEENDLYGPVPPYICERRAQGTLETITTDCYGDVKVWCNCCMNCAPTDMESGDDFYGFSDGAPPPMDNDPEFELRKEKIQGKCTQLSGGSVSILKSPQHDAALWMIYEDKFYLDAESEKFLQRYVSLVLHFTFDKESFFSSSRDECMVDWIECDDDGIITELSFVNDGREGEIPPEVQYLKGLKVIDFRGNRISGSVPGSIGKLTNLESLRLTNNKMTGSVPSEVCNLNSLTDFEVDCNRVYCTCCNNCYRI